MNIQEIFSKLSSNVYFYYGCVAFIVLSFATRLMSMLFVPIDFNEGVFANIGLSMLEGKLLYLDVLDHKSPGIYYLAKGIFSILGTSPMYLRTVSFVMDVVLVLIVFILLRKVLGVRKAIAATAIYSTTFMFFSFGPEALMMILLLLGVLAYLHGKETSKIHYLALAGVLVAAAVYFKQLAFMMAISVGIYEIYLLLKKKQSAKGLGMNLLALASGFLIVAAPLFIYFYALYGVAFVQNAITFNFTYGGNNPIIERLAKIWWVLASQLWLLVALICSNAAEKKFNSSYAFYAFWAIVPLVVFHIGGEFGGLGYIVQIAPALLVLALGPIKLDNSAKLVKILIIIFLLATSLVALKTTYDHYRFDTAGTQQEIASLINANLPEGGKVICDNPAYCFVAGHSSAYPLTMSPAYELWSGHFPDFAKYANEADLLVLTHRQYYVKPEIIVCIRDNWELIYENSGADEYFVEIWKNLGSEC